MHMKVIALKNIAECLPMPCVRRKNHYEKTESITFFYHYDIGGRTGYAFFTVVYLFLFIVVCIQYETGSADQQ